MYAGLVRTQTTTGRSPQDLHDTGRAIIAALAAEYAEIGPSVLGIDDPAQLFARLRDDPAFRWRDGEELLAAARHTIGRAEQAAPRWFGQARSTVRPDQIRVTA